MKFFSKLLHDWNFRHIKIFRLGSHLKRTNLLIQKNLICNKTVCCRHYSSIRKSFDLPPLPPISKNTLDKNSVLGLVIPENSNKILYIPLDYNDSLKKYVLNAEVVIEHIQNIENANFINDTVDIIKFVQRKNNVFNRKSIKDINFRNKNEITKKKLNKNTNLKATSIISLKYMMVDDLRKVFNEANNENDTISFKGQYKGEIFINTDEFEESNKNNVLESKNEIKESIENAVVTTSETKSTKNDYAKTIDFNTFYYDENKAQWGDGVEKKVITDQIKKAKSRNRYSLSKKSNFIKNKRKNMKIQFINTNKVKPKVGDIVKTLEIMSSKPQNDDPDITIGNLEIDKSKPHSSIENDNKELEFIHNTDFEQKIPNQSETQVKVNKNSNKEQDSRDWFEKLLVSLSAQSSTDKDIEQKKPEIEENILQEPKPKIVENKKIVKVHNKLETFDKDHVQNEIKKQQIPDMKLELSQHPILEKINSIEEEPPKEIKSKASNKNENRFKIDSVPEQFSEKINTSNKTVMELKGENLEKLDSKFEKSKSSNLSEINTKEQLPKVKKSQVLNKNEKELKEHAQSPRSDGYKVYLLEENFSEKSDSPDSNKTERELEAKYLPQSDSKFQKPDSSNWNKIDTTDQQMFQEIKFQKLNQNKEDLKEHSHPIQSDGYEVYVLEEQSVNETNSKPTNKNKKNVKAGNFPKDSSLKPWNFKKTSSEEEQSFKKTRSANKNLPKQHSNVKPLKQWNWKKIYLKEEQTSSNMQKSHANLSPLKPWNFKKINSREEQSSKGQQSPQINKNEKVLKMQNIKKHDLNLQSSKSTDWSKANSIEKQNSSKKFKPQSLNRNKKEFKRENLEVEELRLPLNKDNIRDSLGHTEKANSKPEIPEKSVTTNKEREKKNNNSKTLDWLDQLLTATGVKPEELKMEFEKKNSQVNEKITSSQNKTEINKQSLKELNSQQSNKNKNESLELEELRTQPLTKTKTECNSEYNQTIDLESPITSKSETQPEKDLSIISKEIKFQDYGFEPVEQLSKTKKELSIENSNLNQLRFEAFVKQIKMIEANEKKPRNDKNVSKTENKATSEKTLCENNLKDSSNDKVFYNHKIFIKETKPDTKFDQILIEDQNLINNDHLTCVSDKDLNKAPEGTDKTVPNRAKIPTEIILKELKNTSDEISKNKNLNNTKPNDISNNFLIIFTSKPIDITESTNVKDENAISCSEVEEFEIYENIVLNGYYNNIQLMASNILTNMVLNEIYPTLRTTVTDDHNKEDKFLDLNDSEKINKIPIPRIELSSVNHFSESKIEKKHQSKTTEHLKTNQSNAKNENKHKESLLLQGILLNTLINNNICSISSISSSSGSGSSSTSSNSSSTTTASNENDCTNKEQVEPPNVDCCPFPNCSSIPPASCSKDKEKTAILCFRDNACSSKKSESNQDDNECNSK